MKNRIFNTTLLILVALLCTISSMYIGTLNYSEGIFISSFKEPLILLINFIPVFLLLVFILLLTKSFSFSTIFTFVLVNSLAFINYLKVLYRMEPLKYSDKSLVFEGWTMIKKYGFKLNLKLVLGGVAIILLIAILVIILRRVKFSYPRRIFAIIPLLLLVIFTREVIFSDSLYYSLGVESGLNTWLEVDSYSSKGFVYPLIRTIKTSSTYKYKDYDKNRAIATLEKYEEEKIPEDKKVHVISIMLESYKDFYKFQNDSLKFNYDPYEYFHRLQNESIYGSIVPNSLGGGTFETEAHVLTGYKHLPNFNQKKRSYPMYFKENGYSTFAMHPYDGLFYNRVNVYNKLGFDEFYHLGNYFKDYYESIPMDIQVYPHLIEKLNSTINSNRYLFSHIVTYENHGPYSTDKIFGEERPIVYSSEYPTEWYNYFSNYLLGMNSATNALEFLIEHLREFNQPIVVVLYGDHCPSMGEGLEVFNIFGIDADAKSKEGIVNVYETPYLIWGNDAAKNTLGVELVGEGPTMDPEYLFPFVFKTIGYGGDSYNGLLMDLTDAVTVYKDGIFMERVQWTNKLSDDANDRIGDFLNVEYYLGFKKKD